MHRYIRFALSYAPNPESDLAVLGKHWLGWDIAQGKEAAFLKIDRLPLPLPRLVGRQRRFGFQALLVPPFGLASGHSPLDLHHTARAVAQSFAPMSMPGLRLSVGANGLSLGPVGRTVPDQDGPDADIARFTLAVARVFDEFRRPGDTPLRAPARLLSPEQRHWLEDAPAPQPGEAPALKFCISDPMPDQDLNAVAATLRPIIEPNLPRPFSLGSLSLVGEDTSGWFQTIQRYPLTGGPLAPDLALAHATRRVEMPIHW